MLTKQQIFDSTGIQLNKVDKINLLYGKNLCGKTRFLGNIRSDYDSEFHTRFSINTLDELDSLARIVFRKQFNEDHFEEDKNTFMEAIVSSFDDIESVKMNKQDFLPIMLAFKIIRYGKELSFKGSADRLNSKSVIAFAVEILTMLNAKNHQRAYLKKAKYDRPSINSEIILIDDFGLGLDENQYASLFTFIFNFMNKDRLETNETIISNNDGFPLQLFITTSSRQCVKGFSHVSSNFEKFGHPSLSSIHRLEFRPFNSQNPVGSAMPYSTKELKQCLTCGIEYM